VAEALANTMPSSLLLCGLLEGEGENERERERKKIKKMKRKIKYNKM
jgi:hypothetical protein